MASLTLFHSSLLFGAAFLAGGLNAIAGGGSFITFPILIFTGLAPVTANATNNTAIWVAVSGNCKGLSSRYQFSQTRTVAAVCCELDWWRDWLYSFVVYFFTDI